MAFKNIHTIDVAYDNKVYGNLIDPYEWNKNFTDIEQNITANAENLNDNFAMLSGSDGAANITSPDVIGGTDEPSTVSAQLISIVSRLLETYTITELDSKFEQVNANTVHTISFNADNGSFTITNNDGSTTVIDTNIEKIPVSVSLEKNGENVMLVITNYDGTTSSADVTNLLNVYTFIDSNTLRFDADKYDISAEVKKGSITLEHLADGVVSAIEKLRDEARAAKNDAEAAKTAAETAEANAEQSAKISESYAVGTSGIRSGETTDNAKYYSEQSKTYSQMSENSYQRVARAENATITAKNEAETARDEAVEAMNENVEALSNYATVDSVKSVRNDFGRLSGYVDFVGANVGADILPVVIYNTVPNNVVIKNGTQLFLSTASANFGIPGKSKYKIEFYDIMANKLPNLPVAEIRYSSNDTTLPTWSDGDVLSLTYYVNHWIIDGVVPATNNVRGVVKIDSSVDSEDETVAATSAAVKKAYDKAVEAKTVADAAATPEYVDTTVEQFAQSAMQTVEEKFLPKTGGIIEAAVGDTPEGDTSLTIKHGNAGIMLNAMTYADVDDGEGNIAYANDSVITAGIQNENTISCAMMGTHYSIPLVASGSNNIGVISAFEGNDIADAFGDNALIMYSGGGVRALQNLTAPLEDSHATNKKYVDDADAVVKQYTDSELKNCSDAIGNDISILNNRIAPSNSITWGQLALGTVNYANGDGSVENPYRIYTPEQLLFATKMSDSRLTPQKDKVSYKLMSDLDMGNAQITPITLQNSVFDGNGYCIKNFRYTAKANLYSGLFGYCADSTIKDLEISPNLSYEITLTVDNFGLLVGFAKNTIIERCKIVCSSYHINSDKTNSCVGGIAGSLDGTSCVSDCYVSGRCRGEKVGAIAGRVYSNSVNIVRNAARNMFLSNFDPNSANCSLGKYVGYHNSPEAITAENFSYNYILISIRSIAFGATSTYIITDKIPQIGNSDIVFDNNRLLNTSQEKKIENYLTFDFENVWEMNEAFRQPYPRKNHKPF